MRTAVVIPTINGRQEHLERCIEAYWATAPDAKLYIELGHPSCGAAWIAGAERAHADGFEYLHFSADDLEPQDGWLDVAIETVQKGYIPAPLVFHPSGELESAGLQDFGVYAGPHEDWQLIEGTTVPFLTAQMWEQIGMLDIHYCSDLYVSAVGRSHGWQTVIRAGMRFTHHTAPEGRNYGRVPDDTATYLRHMREVGARGV